MSDGPVRVVIVGGGVAGLEALLALRDLAGDRVQLTLVAPEPEFIYRPMAVAEPFGRGLADRHPLATIAADTGAQLMPARVVAVDPERRMVVTNAHERVSYDALLVAVGADSEAAFPRADLDAGD